MYKDSSSHSLRRGTYHLECGTPRQDMYSVTCILYLDKYSLTRFLVLPARILEGLGLLI